jgi:hypothetical protein
MFNPGKTRNTLESLLFLFFYLLSRKGFWGDGRGRKWLVKDVGSRSGENNLAIEDNEAFGSLWSFGPFACNLDSSDSIQHYLLQRDGA